MIKQQIEIKTIKPSNRLINLVDKIPFLFIYGTYVFHRYENGQSDIIYGIHDLSIDNDLNNSYHIDYKKNLLLNKNIFGDALKNNIKHCSEKQFCDILENHLLIQAQNNMELLLPEIKQIYPYACINYNTMEIMIEPQLPDGDFLFDNVLLRYMPKYNCFSCWDDIWKSERILLIISQNKINNIFMDGVPIWKQQLTLISDLHLQQCNKLIFEKILKHSHDIILNFGDLIDWKYYLGNEQKYDEIMLYVNNKLIESNKTMFLLIGNHDTKEFFLNSLEKYSNIIDMKKLHNYNLLTNYNISYFEDFAPFKNKGGRLSEPEFLEKVDNLFSNSNFTSNLPFILFSHIQFKLIDNNNVYYNQSRHDNPTLDKVTEKYNFNKFKIIINGHIHEDGNTSYLNQHTIASNYKTNNYLIINTDENLNLDNKQIIHL